MFDNIKKQFTCCNLFGDELHGEEDDEDELIDNEFEFDESLIWCDCCWAGGGGGGGGWVGGGGCGNLTDCDSYFFIVELPLIKLYEACLDCCLMFCFIISLSSFVVLKDDEQEDE